MNQERAAEVNDSRRVTRRRCRGDLHPQPSREPRPGRSVGARKRRCRLRDDRRRPERRRLDRRRRPSDRRATRALPPQQDQRPRSGAGRGVRVDRARTDRPHRRRLRGRHPMGGGHGRRASFAPTCRRGVLQRRGALATCATGATSLPSSAKPTTSHARYSGRRDHGLGAGIAYRRAAVTDVGGPDTALGVGSRFAHARTGTCSFGWSCEVGGCSTQQACKWSTTASAPIEKAASTHATVGSASARCSPSSSVSRL